jgi:FkbH-like protein
MDRFAAIRVARDIHSFDALSHKLSALLIGFCDVQFGSDILRDEARSAGIDLDVTATFETDTAAAAEKSFDFIIIGALAARHGQWFRSDGEGDFSPRRYIAALKRIVDDLRARSSAPILINNLPLPTSSPGGVADRGEANIIERCRSINAQLAEMARTEKDFFVVDVDAVLSLHGKHQLLDDRLVPYSHAGSLGWWSMLPAHEKRSIHGIDLPFDPAKSFGLSDPFAYDRLVAREQLLWIRTLRGIGRRKCVLVDLDNTLWPGVLADTGSPFPRELDFTLFSYHSIFVGLHQALRALKERGILLACISKNDEAVVRELWSYPRSAPADLLTLDDFVTHRINWNEKSDNIATIAHELNLGLDAFVVVDDNPIERDKIRRALPDVLVLGDDFGSLRWQLLTMPELQVVSITAEARQRSDSTRAAIQREQLRQTTLDPEEYLGSLALRCTIERVAPASGDVDRIHELILRTNQFNTTTLRLSRGEVENAISRGELYTLRATDRFTDYGLVGVAVLRGRHVALLLLSCRVIGLRLEHALLDAMIEDLGDGVISGAFVPSAKNTPARNVFREHGFVQANEGEWTLAAPLNESAMRFIGAVTRRKEEVPAETELERRRLEP